MNIQDTLDIMNSDMKLWEAADSKPVANGVEKTIELPWGIGTVTVTMEGMNDATKKREAVGAYANYIRGLITEAINDEAVTARAKAAASRAEPADSGDSIIQRGEQRVRDSAVQAKGDAEAGETYGSDAEEPVGFRDALVAKRSALTERINAAERSLRNWRTELRAVEAAIASLEEEEGDDPKQ